MTVNCVWEHNGNDTLLYAVDYVGAYARGESIEVAVSKMPAEIASYLRWRNKDIPKNFEIVIAGEKESALNIQDADSDVLFENEKAPLTPDEYMLLKNLTLKSAEDFWLLYQSIPNKDTTCLPIRKTFYGAVPRTANEMYAHTKNVTEYYFAEINVDVTNEGNIIECRQKGFEALEEKTEFLQKTVLQGSYGEEWSIRKVLRRFIWHDRIHAKAMYRMAVKMFDKSRIANPFFFDE